MLFCGRIRSCFKVSAEGYRYLNSNLSENRYKFYLSFLQFFKTFFSTHCFKKNLLQYLTQFQYFSNYIIWIGQTWLLTILYLMDNSEKLERGETIEKEERLAVPFFEMQYLDERPRGWELIEQIPDPRTIKTHLPLCYWKDGLDKSPGTKVIQTVRNPKDTLVSLYHFCRMNQYFGWFNGTWDSLKQWLMVK